MVRHNLIMVVILTLMVNHKPIIIMLTTIMVKNGITYNIIGAT
jgi:hypothetical protein